MSNNKATAKETADAAKHDLVAYREDGDGYWWRCRCGETGTDPDGQFDGTNPCPKA